VSAARESRRRYYSVLEICEIYGLHRQTVYSMIARGLIPSIRIGRAVRVDLRELDRRLKAQGQETRR
jgi:excisionase family DNA binding protein